MDRDPKKVSVVATLKLFLWDCIHVAYKAFIAPRKDDDEERRVEFILNTILAGTIIFTTYLESLLVIQRFIWVPFEHIPYTGVPVILFTIIYGISLSLLYLSRKGHIKLASYGLIAFYFIGTTYSAYIWGPYLYQVILDYALIIVIASILLKARVGFFLTLLIALSMIVLSLLDIHHHITFDDRWKHAPTQLSDTIKFSLTYSMIMFISWLSNREIKRSLVRARASEKALREKNESLEEIVEERTKALQTVQAEKVSELYRFAEFGRLSSGMFHDLMNPLTILGLHVGELRTLAPTDAADVKVHIDKAIVASSRIEGFIASIKKQMTMNTNEMIFCLNDEIDEALMLLNYKANQTGATLEFNAEQTLHTYGNPSKFDQIITNIISNAIDATDDVTIPKERKTIIIALKKQDGKAVITISDKGCGVPHEHLHKIFDPFFTTKSQHKGMGLGLSTTKSAVENLHGTIEVLSKENEGTTFIITIPLKKHAKSPAP